MIDHLPKDAMMLLSFINTRLRDQYEDLNTLCEDMNVSKEMILLKLAEIDYHYSRELNRFV